MSSENRCSRRQFLRGAATIAGAGAIPYFVPPSAMGSAGAVAPSERIAMGFIGLGIQGSGLMGAFLGQKDVQAVAVCDVRASQRQRAKQTVDQRYGNSDCAMYNDFREVCGRTDIDAVCIATPDHWHVLVSLEAARNGKDMYTEKALGLSLAWPFPTSRRSRSRKVWTTICGSARRRGRPTPTSDVGQWGHGTDGTGPVECTSRAKASGPNPSRC